MLLTREITRYKHMYKNRTVNFLISLIQTLEQFNKEIILFSVLIQSQYKINLYFYKKNIDSDYMSAQFNVLDIHLSDITNYFKTLNTHNFTIPEKFMIGNLYVIRHNDCDFLLKQFSKSSHDDFILKSTNKYTVKSVIDLIDNDFDHFYNEVLKFTVSLI